MPEQEWFDRDGLRFTCTMCGNCCSGPEGIVLVTPEEIRILAARCALDDAEFRSAYTRQTRYGISLVERPTAHGRDCIFLDRTTRPGKAICGVYEDRPAQCRTWPFWESNLTTRQSWQIASRTCPGMNKGKLYPSDQIRIIRDKVKI